MSSVEKILRGIAHKTEIHTIRTKLIISFLIMALLPLATMSFFSYRTYFGSVTNQISQYSQEVVNRMALDLDDYFLDIEVLLTREQDFYIDQMIKLVHGNDFNNRKYTFRIWEDFNNLSRAKPGVEEIALTFPNGIRFSNNGLYTIDSTDFVLNVQTTMNARETAIIGPYTNFLNRPVISMVRSYTSSSAEDDVYISAEINLERLANVTNVKLGQSGYVFIADESGRVIYHPVTAEIGAINSFYQAGNTNAFQGGTAFHDGQEFYLTTASSPVTGWSVVSVAYAEEIGSELTPIQNMTWIVITLIFISATLVAIYLSHSLSRPIKELQDLTQRAANNELSVHIETRGKDEIAQLGYSFNKMISRIQELMNENVREQKLLRKLEMESLDNQIKPHFIYNTLDLIIGQLESNNNDRASYLIEALGNFFRLSLSKGRETVPISSEIEHVRNYLFIQQLRHGEEYQYSIDVRDTSVLTSFMPRLLLQPLVENAIYHGVLPAGGQRKIMVTIYSVGDDVVFEIIDDGVGIPPDKLHEINDILSGIKNVDSEKEYFGLRNVNRRAKLMFGDRYGVTLESVQGQGTKAILRIRTIGNETL